MQTRLAKKSELSTLAQLDREVNLTAWSYQEYQECLNNKNQHIYLGIDSGKIIGCIVYNMVLDEAEILQLWIAKTHQNKGCGKQLLTQLFQVLGYQVERVFLEVRENNAIAIKLYHGLKFIEVGKRAGYYKVDGWQFDALIMLKHLK